MVLRTHVPKHQMKELRIPMLILIILISSLYAYYENDAWRMQER